MAPASLRPLGQHPTRGVTIFFFAELFLRGLGPPACAQLDHFTDKTQRASIAVTDPLRRGPGFRAPSHFRGESPPGGDHFPSAHRGRFRAIFLIVFGDGFVGAHLNCEGVNFGPAAGAMLDPVWVPLSSQKIKGF